MCMTFMIKLSVSEMLSSLSSIKLLHKVSLSETSVTRSDEDIKSCRAELGVGGVQD